MVVRRGGLAVLDSVRGRMSVVAGLIVALAAAVLVVVVPPAGAAPSTLTLVIESVRDVDDPEDGFDDGSCWGDYVFTVNFAGVTSVSGEYSDDPSPPIGCVGQGFQMVNFEVSRTVDTDDVAIPVLISVMEIDSITDDIMDASPVDGEKTLELTVDPYLGSWAPVDADGEPVPGISFPGGATSATIQGDGEDDAERVGLTIRIFATGASDADGDGLLDSWETSGYDADGDGNPEVDLPAMGASPNHKDLFVELDTANGRTLGRDDLQAIKNAFAAAPLPNPDGTTGVRLWIDTGHAVDPGAREGQALGTCSDGIDNSGDGATDAADSNCTAAPVLSSNNVHYLDASVEDPLAPNCQNGVDDDADGKADGNDPDCIAGEPGALFTGGNAITGSPAICNLDPDFYAAKMGNFDTDRRPIFRYAISTPAASCDSGGQAEIGGNDFVDHNGDGGTIMHELGHTLTLRHGGNVDFNCKPNLVSVMSYFSQFGIGRKDGGAILDYSPPRQGILSGPRSTSLPVSILNEAALHETTPVDASDATNKFVFVDGDGDARWVPLDSQPNWDGDDAGVLSTTTVRVNIDTADKNGDPSRCANTDLRSLRGADEWFQVSLPFRQFGDSADGAVNPDEEPHPTLDELVDFLDALTTTDLATSATDAPDPVAAGTTVTIGATVTNTGSNAADGTELVLTPDARLSPTNLPAGCAAVGADVHCGVGTLAPGASRLVNVDFLVAADLVHVAGAPTSVNVRVESRHAGDDPDSTDNVATTSTLVVAVADLSVASPSATNQPLLLVVGRTSTISLDAAVANAGPSSPMDATAAFGASGTGVTTAGSTTAVPALAVGTPRTASGTVQVTCTQPGLRQITLNASIAPTKAADSDPAGANNTATRTVTIDCAVPVQIDVEPGDASDTMKVFGAGNAFVGVFTTRAGEYGLPIAFDAATIRPGTVRLGRASAVQSGGGLAPWYADLRDLLEFGPAEQGKDRDSDQRLFFERARVPLVLGDTEACVIGKFDSASGPLTFFGCGPATIDPGP